MGQLSSKLRSVANGKIGYWCQGCEEMHAVRVVPDRDRPLWAWDGNVDAPTFSPSVLVTLHDPDGELPDERCHTFIKAGMVQFLGDCTHALAGQTLPLPDLPPGLTNDAA